LISNEPIPYPKKILKHRRVGSLWISVSNSGVRLERGGKILVGSSDSVAKQLEPFQNLLGSQLPTIAVRPPGGDTTFLFENDLALTCFPASRGTAIRGSSSRKIRTNSSSDLAPE
jgi:hypothetical protein